MSIWLEIAIGLSLGLIAANTALLVIFWPLARDLRDTGLTVRETHRTLRLRLEADLSAALKRLENRLGQ